MLQNLNKNRFWFWKAMETYGLGIYFIVKHNTFALVPPRPSLFDLFDAPPAIFLLAVVGTMPLIYSLGDVNIKFYKPAMAGALTFVWMFFMIAFIAHDYGIAKYISFESMYAFFVLASMVHEQTVRG
ncbi:hypothetical protein LFAB_05310 [Lactiplantibacillus fabifermentans T30PCM01]|uniref:Uncharacterized protein n=1 Tax=Lactiplantibacillus fabifermentans T30PCM01 TaxID=1400520 RepID=W6TCP8_9LACO|nr:hypothetical protein [Lactiplantibacillus fabifermentans]ETY74765.1 hypothetical protein LFAB_05310 [Lactiplantibacillus fabifermentans T30PCM01]